MQNLSITWLGHSSFSLKTPGGKTLLLDPWYTGNPSFPENAKPKQADLILISHGHSDHITDAAAMAKATGATVVGIWEVTSWLGTKGVKNLEPMNKGGSIEPKRCTAAASTKTASSIWVSRRALSCGSKTGSRFISPATPRSSAT
jgi:L-ascorbate metabolism protein UlaG (beta-lactamase superfamily)